MSSSPYTRPRTVRLIALGTAVSIIALGLTIRSVGDGALQQHSGTALYASMIYAGVLFLAPRTAPLTVGVVAVALCWAVEFTQLTGVPAALSARSLVARLVLGAQFDWSDVAWYPAGVLPLLALHATVLRRRTRAAARRMAGAGDVRQAGAVVGSGEASVANGLGAPKR